MPKKKSLTGWTDGRCFFLFNYRFKYPSFSISNKRIKPDDVKVRITIEELK